MPVLHYGAIYIITEKLKNLATKALDKNPLFLTKEEYIEAFIQPDHIEKLTEVFELAGGPGTPMGVDLTLETALNGKYSQVRARMGFFNNPGLIIPHYAESGYNLNTPTGVKIMEWAAERRRMGLVVGDAMDAIQELNERCDTGYGLSLMFPAITSIMVRTGEEDSPLHKKATKMMNGKLIGNVPKLTPESKERLREASAVVQVLCMVESAADPVKPRDACCQIASFSGTGGIAYSRPHILDPAVRTTQSFI